MMVPVKRKIGCCYSRWRRLSYDHCGRSSNPPVIPSPGGSAHPGRFHFGTTARSGVMLSLAMELG